MHSVSLDTNVGLQGKSPLPFPFLPVLKPYFLRETDPRYIKIVEDEVCEDSASDRECDYHGEYSGTESSLANGGRRHGMFDRTEGCFQRCQSELLDRGGAAAIVNPGCTVQEG